ncbi:MAG TPA: AI-2E family transporter [Steroidobacteraceae bacterium]|nr:AI-2E family transporter [Steroidobacteraceae bacterium]
MALVSPPATPVTRTDLIGWIVTAIALGLVIQLHLLSALLAGLLVYKLVDVLTPWLRIRELDRNVARALAVTLIATAVIAALVGIGIGIVAVLRNSGETLPLLMQKMAQIVEETRGKLPAALHDYIPEDAVTLQATIAGWLREHAGSLQLAGRGIGRSLVHMLIGMIIGALLSLQKASAHPDRQPLAQDISQRASRLAAAFQRVVFAQVWISLVNTLLTWIYLDVVLRLFGVDLPLVKILVALTFVVGLVPIIGNLLSNTAIVIVCLSNGLPVAVASLAFLIVIHKLEYFLNARIIGSHINAKAFELLIAMLVMEAAFGLTGLVAAPILYAYFKEELRQKGLV